MTLREDIVVLGGFLRHPTTTNMNIALLDGAAEGVVESAKGSEAQITERVVHEKLHRLNRAMR